MSVTCSMLCMAWCVQSGLPITRRTHLHHLLDCFSAELRCQGCCCCSCSCCRVCIVHLQQQFTCFGAAASMACFGISYVHVHRQHDGRSSKMQSEGVQVSAGHPQLCLQMSCCDGTHGTPQQPRLKRAGCTTAAPSSHLHIALVRTGCLYCLELLLHCLHGDRSSEWSMDATGSALCSAHEQAFLRVDVPSA